MSGFSALGLKPYVPLPTVEKFHRDESFFRCIRGPIGSGKSVGCVMELLLRSLRQEPVNGVRKTRWAIIRNTHAQLVATSMATFKDRFPEFLEGGQPFFPITQEDRGYMKGKLKNAKLPDGTIVDMEVLFIALDGPGAYNKIKSLDITGAWINELSELDKTVFHMVAGRCGRYPPEEGGHCATWDGIIADTNPPDTDHWLARLEVERPQIEYNGKVYRYNFFVQPPALIPIMTNGKRIYVPNNGKYGYAPAENITHLKDGFGYYIKQIPGASEDWIKVFILGQFGDITSGKSVYHEFNNELHVSKEELKPLRMCKILIGLDFGYASSAAILCQFSPTGELLVLDELLRDKSGIKSFITEDILPLLHSKYEGIRFVAIGDPAGIGHSSVDGTSPIQAACDSGLPTERAVTNDPVMRQEAVRNILSRLIDGHPAMKISPTCKHLIKGFNGKYKFKKSGSREVVDKNEYSHIQDALQYVCVNRDVIDTKTENYFGSLKIKQIESEDYPW